jgi:hypothetical protein
MFARPCAGEGSGRRHFDFGCRFPHPPWRFQSTNQWYRQFLACTTVGPTRAYNKARHNKGMQQENGLKNSRSPSPLSSNKGSKFRSPPARLPHDACRPLFETRGFDDACFCGNHPFFCAHSTFPYAQPRLLVLPTINSVLLFAHSTCSDSHHERKPALLYFINHVSICPI